MSDDYIPKVYKQFRKAQDRHAYYLLAVAGAGIAFAVTQTRGVALSWTHATLGCAVALWAASFLAGCRLLGYLASCLYANLDLLKVERGVHPGAGRDPAVIAAASEGIRKALDRNSSKAELYGRLQFRFLSWGAVLFVAWHVLEMWLRSIS